MSFRKSREMGARLCTLFDHPCFSIPSSTSPPSSNLMEDNLERGVEDLCLHIRLQRALPSYPELPHSWEALQNKSFRTRSSEEPRENCTMGHTGQCQNRALRVKVPLYTGQGAFTDLCHTCRGCFPATPSHTNGAAAGKNSIWKR